MKRLAMLLAGVSLPAWAGEQPAPVESLELATLLDLEVAAPTKQATPLAASPAVGAAFVRSQIEDFDFLSPSDLILTQPGFFPARDYERRTIGARGEHEAWNNNRLLLLIDGLPQNDVETGTAFTSEVTPLYLARSVEVLRGPGSALYGSYALHGVVAIDTVSPADLGGSRAIGRLRLGSGTATADVLGSVTSPLVDAVLAWNRFTTTGDHDAGVDLSGRAGDIPDDHSSSSVFFKGQARGALEGLTLTLQRQSWDYATGRGWLYFTPDAEQMGEWRELASLRYRTSGAGGWSQEYAVQLQRHGYRMDVRMYPDGALDGTYPAGVTERIDTRLTSGFVRAQIGKTLPRRGQLLAGVEYTALVYDGDRLHTANIDMASEGAPPLATQMPLRALYEPMMGHPVSKLGVFTQLTTGELLGERLELVAGLRYDNLFFTYTDVDDPARPDRSHSFQDLSPRVAVIWNPVAPLHLKLMAARAFRTPTAVELFAANTWTAASTDIASLEAERQDSYELAADWRIAGPLRLRSNAYVAKLDHQIGYAANNDTIVNRLDDVRAGVENELVFDASLGRTAVDGWLSWSFVALLSETVTDPDLATSDEVTRAPTQLGKLGARLRRGPLTATLQGMFHGEVHRRASDLVDERHRALRPDVLPAWMTFDASLYLRATGWARVGVSARNLTASGTRITAIGDLPFDYDPGDRRVMFEVSLEP